MPLNDAEKERCRYHLGYLNVRVPTALGLGFPSASQLMLILESSMNDLLPDAEPGVRRAIQELDCIEDQLSAFRPALQLKSSGGGVQFSGDEGLLALEGQYRWWSMKLADTLGTPVNPFSLTHQQLGTLGGGCIEPT